MEKIGILWDLDGTLLDTLDDLYGSVNHTLRSLNFPERTLDEVRRFVGSGARRLMEQAVPAGMDASEAYDRFRAYYDSHCRIKTRPYAGIPGALARIGAKYPMAIVSNKPDSAVKLLSRDYFGGIFARGEDTDCPRKPAPDMVRQAMAAIGVSRCVYVGDSEVDVITARNAGVPCLSVLWGFRDKEELIQAGAQYFCEDVTGLPRIIDEIVSRL